MPSIAVYTPIRFFFADFSIVEKGGSGVATFIEHPDGTFSIQVLDRDGDPFYLVSGNRDELIEFAGFLHQLALWLPKAKATA